MQTTIGDRCGDRRAPAYILLRGTNLLLASGIFFFLHYFSLLKALQFRNIASGQTVLFRLCKSTNNLLTHEFCVGRCPAPSRVGILLLADSRYVFGSSKTDFGACTFRFGLERRFCARTRDLNLPSETRRSRSRRARGIRAMTANTMCGCAARGKSRNNRTRILFRRRPCDTNYYFIILTKTTARKLFVITRAIIMQFLVGV